MLLPDGPGNSTGMNLIPNVWSKVNYQLLIEQVQSDNDASEVDISRQFGRLFDEFGPFGLVIIGSFKKRVTDPWTDKPSYRDAWTHLKTNCWSVRARIEKLYESMLRRT